MLILALALGCAPPEAPDDIEEMMVFGFEHFDDDDPRPLTDLAEKLIPWMDAHIEEIVDGYAVHALTQERLLAVGVTPEVEVVEGIAGALSGVDFSVPPADIAVAYAHPHQEDIFTSYIEFTREARGDAACFAAGDCARFEATDTVRSNAVLDVEMLTTYDAAYRWITLEDGREVVVQRNLGPTPVELTVDFIAVHQQYSFSMSYPLPEGGARRAWAIWADGEIIGADMPESWQLTQGVNAMHRAAANIERWLAGEPAEG